MPAFYKIAQGRRLVLSTASGALTLVDTMRTKTEFLRTLILILAILSYSTSPM